MLIYQLKSPTLLAIFYSKRTLCFGPPPLVHFHTLLGYPIPLSERKYFLNDPYICALPSALPVFKSPSALNFQMPFKISKSLFKTFHNKYFGITLVVDFFLRNRIFKSYHVLQSVIKLDMMESRAFFSLNLYILFVVCSSRITESFVATLFLEEF